MPKIKIYTTHTCPYCFMLKDYLKQHDTVYDEVFIDADPVGAAQALDTCGSMATPCIHITLDTGEEVRIVGFNKPKLDEVLGLVQEG